MICGRSAECINSVGSYKCQCKDGFKEGSNERSCDDIDECTDMPGLCEHTCVNVWGGYRCACKPGFILNADNRLVLIFLVFCRQKKLFIIVEPAPILTSVKCLKINIFVLECVKIFQEATLVDVPKDIDWGLMGELVKVCEMKY